MRNPKMSAAEQRSRVIAIRAEALAIMKKYGAWESVGSSRLLTATTGSVSISYWTPFQKLPPESDAVAYTRALAGQKPKLPYGLEIWAYGKVMNIEWDDKGALEILSFKPGEWETAMTPEGADGRRGAVG